MQNDFAKLQDLLDKGPAWLAGWLRHYEEGMQEPNSLLDGISEGAAHRARVKSSPEWAMVAIRAAELWALTGAKERELAIYRAMLLRAWFISKKGASLGHPIFDKEIILHWFNSGLKLSTEAAKEKIACWHDSRLPLDARLSKDELSELRKIKNRLGVVKLLADCGELPIDSKAHEWLEMRSQLP